MRILRLALLALLVAASALPALAVDNVLWDSSGNGLLNGTYNFREVMWSNRGDTHRIAIYGSIQFDGNGGYTLTSSVMDSDIGSVQSFSTTGAYRISASGMGFLDDPIRLANGKPISTVWGLATQSTFIGSGTDDGINNLFIATLGPFTLPGNPNPNDRLKGGYWAVGVNIPSAVVAEARDMLIRLDSDGQGHLTTVNLTGLVGLSAATVTQTVTGATYSIGNEALNLSFGGSGQLDAQTLISGNVLCYFSSNGDFFFGGSRTGWDMIVGVRAIDGTVPSNVFNGKYFQIGADVTPTKGFQTLSTYYGSLSALGDSGTVIGHQRVLPADPMTNFQPYDFTYSDTAVLAPDGTYDDFLQFHHVHGSPGTSVPTRGLIQIGVGRGSHLGINLAMQGRFQSGPGVYLKPDGIANAGSSAPFTVGVSRGEFIALYGSNLSPTTLQDESKPFLLGGVQVLINNRPAPIRYVRSDVVLAIVPFATTGTVASVQVINNGVPSEIRTVRVKNGTPGIYTSPAGGVGYAVAQHVQDNSFATVTPQNPAHPGETILVYLTGLGDVDPPVDDGQPASANPLSLVVRRPVALVDGKEATVGFAGLTPSLIALYAMHVTIPAGVRLGDRYLDISLPDSYTSEAQIPIGNNSLGIQTPAETLLLSTPPPERPPVQIPGTLRRFPDR